MRFVASVNAEKSKPSLCVDALISVATMSEKLSGCIYTTKTYLERVANLRVGLGELR